MDVPMMERIAAGEASPNEIANWPEERTTAFGWIRHLGEADKPTKPAPGETRRAPQASAVGHLLQRDRGGSAVPAVVLTARVGPWLCDDRLA
jgi:hypothetical protein